MKELFQYNPGEFKTLSSIFILLIILGFIVFAYQWRNIKMASIRYNISKLELKKKSLIGQLEKLKFSVADKSTTARIEKLYRKRYGYIPIRLSRKIITLKMPTLGIEK